MLPTFEEFCKAQFIKFGSSLSYEDWFTVYEAYLRQLYAEKIKDQESV